MPAKTTLFDWTTPFDFHHSIFLRWDRSGMWLFVYVIFSGWMWSNFTLQFHLLQKFFANFQWDISGNWISIYNLCCNTVTLKKNCKTFLVPNLVKNWASMGHAQDQVHICLLEITKGDHKLSKTFYFIKSFNRFEWLFFLLGYILLPKLAISSWNSCQK